MASSSGTSSVSVVSPKEKYDVFISFRGKDTRRTFTSHLHAALIRRKVDTYIDYRLERGDEVGPALLKAIKESRISVIIFSENYADSTWCLDELAYILECKETHGQHVIPIFYEVEPSDVRHQLGSYATAFAEHELRSKDTTVKVPMWKGALVKISNLMQFTNQERTVRDKVVRWKEALSKAANLSGFDSRTVGNDFDLVEEVVGDVLAKLNRESSSDLTGLIGAENRIQKILLDLDMMPEDVRIRFLVIWGMGGIGKTTLADVVYHGLSSQFESHCFLANVRARSGTKGDFSPELYALRDELLGELLEDRSLKIGTRTIGGYAKERLQRSKVLVVLDDVNDSSQLTFLAQEVPFGPGSRIIITTRDMQPVKETLVLNEDRDVKIHEVEKLNPDESLQLFYLNQSKASTLWTENSKSLQRVLDYATGIPLALKILPPLFIRCKGKEELEKLWASLKEFPNKKLQNVYRASYNVLEENEKEIFLDIACFHKTKKLCDAKRIMAACGLFPDNGIEILIDMSLISIKDDYIWMHDVIHEMGCEIVREECVDDAGKRSRVYTFEDVCHVLENNKGTAAVKGISLNMAWFARNVMLTGKAFTEMDNLRFLDFDFWHYNYKVNVNTELERLPNALKFLSWPQYLLKSLPSNFSLENLVELHMRKSRLQGLWNQGQGRPKNLRRIDLSDSSELTEVPDLSNCVYIESINLAGCHGLSHIPSYFRNLTKLTYLNLSECSKVRKLPALPREIKFLYLDWYKLEELHSSIWSMENLPELNLEGYRGNIPNVTWNLRSVTSLVLTGTRVESLPSSIENLSEVVSVDLRACKSLVSLPTTICKLKSLERLDLRGCTELKMFPEIEDPMERLEYLSLRKTGIEQLPPSIGNLVGLKTLDLSWCNRLELVPSGIYKLKHLERLDLLECIKLKMFPEIEEPMERLEDLDLRWTGIEELPQSIGNLVGLKTLYLTRCERLELVPSGIYKLKHLETLHLRGCTRLEMFPEIEEPMERLKDLDLEGTGIEELPQSIGNLVGLTSLNIKNCKQLRSLPELPYHLRELIADGCTALEEVPRTAWKRVLIEEVLYFVRHTFWGCLKLKNNARSNIMEDAQIRIMRLANYVWSNIKEDAQHTYHEAYAAVTMWPGNEIPRWFSCQTEGSIINIKLPTNLGNVLGVALCVVVTIHKASSLNIRCKSIFITNRGGKRRVNLDLDTYVSVSEAENSDHILVWYDHRYEQDVNRSTEASFEFIDRGPSIEVKRCGLSFVYAEGHDDGLKFEDVHPPQGDDNL